MAGGDDDNDGDLDILLTGYSSDGVARVYRNDGPAPGAGWNFVDIGVALTGVFYSSVAWGDYDNDGDLDILFTGADSSFNPVARVYRNDGGGFVAISAPLTGVASSSVAGGDYDNDGDLDILLTGVDNSNNPVARLYRNEDRADLALTKIFLLLGEPIAEKMYSPVREPVKPLRWHRSLDHSAGMVNPASASLHGCCGHSPRAEGRTSISLANKRR